MDYDKTGRREMDTDREYHDQTDGIDIYYTYREYHNRTLQQRLLWLFFSKESCKPTYTIVHTSKPVIHDVVTQEIVDKLADMSNPFSIHCSTQQETQRVCNWLFGDSRYENVHIDTAGNVFVQLAGSYSTIED